MSQRTRLVVSSFIAALFLTGTTVVLAQTAQPAVSKAQVQVALNPTLGNILVNSKGFTLYHLTKENTGHFHCKGACLKLWPPLLLPKGLKSPKGATGVTDKVGVVKRKGIGRQITYDGFPLYRYAPDTKPGDIKGQNFGKVWFALPPAPMLKLTINVTNTGGTVWGTVKTSSTYHGTTSTSSCNLPSCTTQIHAGTKVHLSQTETNSATWVFQKWTLKAAHGGFNKSNTSSSAVLLANDSYKIGAVYVVTGYPGR